MTIIIDGYVIPEKGRVELNVQRSFEIKITAEEARRKVNRWLHDNVTIADWSRGADVGRQQAGRLARIGRLLCSRSGPRGGCRNCRC